MCSSVFFLNYLIYEEECCYGCAFFVVYTSENKKRDLFGETFFPHVKEEGDLVVVYVVCFVVLYIFVSFGRMVMFHCAVSLCVLSVLKPCASDIIRRDFIKLRIRSKNFRAHSLQLDIKNSDALRRCILCTRVRVCLFFFFVYLVVMNIIGSKL